MKHYFHILPSLLHCALLVQFSLELITIMPEDIVSHDRLDTNKKSVQEEAVTAHNDIRRNVTPSAGNMLQMKWNEGLAKLAQRLVSRCSLKHSHPEDRVVQGLSCGENIMISPELVSWTYCTKRWEDEKFYYDFGVGAKGNRTVAHYTQLVTDYTHIMGCAYAICPKYGINWVFYLCLYFPPGNQPEKLKWPYTAGKPCSLCMNACDGNRLCTNFCDHANIIANCGDYMRQEGCYYPGVKNVFCRAACYCKGKIK